MFSTKRLKFYSNPPLPLSRYLCSSLLTLAGAGAAAAPTIASAAEEAEGVMEEVVSIGTRSAGRSVTDIPVPVDLLSEEELRQTGGTETGRILQSLAPSFNFSSSTISDGTDALRPATLRGLGPDQTLVLLNGKRRHIGALVHVNTSVGRGTAGTDLNAIPPSALGRVEVLRDGAAAQYGSDAIAGVINLVLNDSSEGGSVDVSYGQYKENDGETIVVNGNRGFAWGDDGFVNISAEYRDRGRTNRAGLFGSQIYPLEADGSFDQREFTANRNNFRIGDSDSDQIAVLVNASRHINDTTRFYSFATYSDRESTSGGFFRAPIQTTRNPAGSDYPDGFLPLINTTISDFSLAGGIEKTFDDGWIVDASVVHGRNRFEFDISNSHNASAVNAFGSSPSSAHAGELVFEQTTFNVDIAKEVDWGNIAFGGEYRMDAYEINAGEPLSYLDFDGLAPTSGDAGIQVFPGFQPDNEVDEDRDSIAVYGDVEYNISDNLLVSGAIRYEDYSDFGDTLNGKIATRWNAIPDLLTVRGAVSTGFRAPSMQQQFFNNKSTQFNSAGMAETIATLRNDSAAAMAIGIPALEEETSTNYSVGVILTPIDQLTITLDLYRIEIDDRIVISGRLRGTPGDVLDTALALDGADAAQFFLNAGDTETEGADLVVTYNMLFDEGGNLRVSFAGNYTNTKVTSIFAPASLSSSPRDIFTVQDESIIEDWQPKDRVNLTFNYNKGPFTANVAFNRYGEYTTLDGTEQTFSAKTLTDVQLSYALENGVTFRIGGNNIFDETPDGNEFGQSRTSPAGGLVDPVTDEFVIDSPGVFAFSRRSAPFGFNGAYYYAGVRYEFE